MLLSVLCRSVVTVDPDFAFWLPIATHEYARGIPVTLLELLPRHLLWLASEHHSPFQQSSPPMMHVNTNHSGARHPLRLQSLRVALDASCPGVSYEWNWTTEHITFLCP